MLFTNSRTINKHKQGSSQTPHNPMMVMTLTSNRLSGTNNRPLQSTQVVAASSQPDRPDGRKKWGPPVWYFFHTIAEKIQPEHFATLRKDILRYIEIICQNLPCPSCSAHASEYISRVNKNSIQSKEDLQKMLFVFHNTVNARNGQPEFLYDKLSETYSKANTINIYNHFIRAFSDKHYSIRLIADDMYRSRLCKQITSWFSDNIKYFDK